jgi:hypothetical protein
MVNTIDEFFESLKWEEFRSNPVVSYIPFGKLMKFVDMDNRWVYKGSLTTPPCDSNVYWNVVRRIFPIKLKHVDLFLNQLERGILQFSGNYRQTQAIQNHDPHIISTDTDQHLKEQKIDSLKVSNHADGSVIVVYNASEGNTTTFTSKPDGSYKVFF